MTDQRDNMSRAKRPSPLGTSLFIGLRSFDVFIQYGILARALANPTLNHLSKAPVARSADIVAFGLSLQRLIVLGIGTGTAIKQILWMPLGNSIKIDLANTVFNSINSILALTTLASRYAPSVFGSTDNLTAL